jgi:hypothetical protein
MSAGQLGWEDTRTSAADLSVLVVGRHGVIRGLFEPDFLNKARQEIVSQISFREKETDICEYPTVACAGFGQCIHPPSATFPY